MTAAPPPSTYPPPRHALRDLGLWFEAGAEALRAGLPLRPELLGASGTLDAGVLAVLVDVVAGGPALRAANGVRPSEAQAVGGVSRAWIATSDLSLHVKAPARRGEAVATPRVHRAGKSQIVIEVEVRCGEASIAFARAGFVRLEARGGHQAQERAPTPGRLDWAVPGGGFTGSWREALGVRVRDAAAGDLELPLTPYVGNSLGGLQGGLSAALSAFAAEAAAATPLGPGVAALDLGLHFLSLARVGPVRTRATLERASSGSALMRVEARDAGAGDRLCTVASVLVGAHAP